MLVRKVVRIVCGSVVLMCLKVWMKRRRCVDGGVRGGERGRAGGLGGGGLLPFLLFEFISSLICCFQSR